MTAILGLSAFYHDSAAALIVDGRIVAAAQEERFSRIKHDSGFPKHSIDYCLSEAAITIEELDQVAFYEKPYLKFERILENYLSVAPAGFNSFRRAMPQWIHEKLRLTSQLSNGLGERFERRFIFVEHHESHAASAFFPSPFEDAAILTIDGVGEWSTATIGYGSGSTLELKKEIRYPHSVGLLYSAFTYFCGFRVNSGEYKLMGLAPFGSPRYAEVIRNQLIDLKEDGSFRMDMSYFGYCSGLVMTSRKFEDLFGGRPRKSEDPITERECDLAASIQVVTEEIMLKMAAFALKVTNSKNLCLAGGVALNCVGNGRLKRESGFQNVWVQPASGDAGGALGSALFVWHQLLGSRRIPNLNDSLSGSFLGPRFTSEYTANVLTKAKAIFERITVQHEMDRRIAKMLASGCVVGWMQGRMEFGPRALGARSILGDARDPTMQSKMNLKIKFRESFRPFAPIVLQDRVSEYFHFDSNSESPYMLMVAPVIGAKRSSGSEDGAGLNRINQARSGIPAVTHVDGSARIQTVDSSRNPRLYDLLAAFDQLTGCPILINTSFNIRGEPIVCSPEDAYRCFMATDIDALVIDDFLLLKSAQPDSNRIGREVYLKKYGND